jgi:SAM-dependent methyltransferase
LKHVRLDPPGTLCAYEALRDVVRRTPARTFVDVGCGQGGISKLLCSLGMTGYGIDFSPLAIEASTSTLSAEIAAGRYRLVEADVTSLDHVPPPADLGVSFMVMEHVHDDVAFVGAVSALVRPGGMVAIFVQGRADKWSFEDETVGHLRRYERDALRDVLRAGGLQQVQVWSVAVPVANILQRPGTALVRRSGEARKIGQSRREQTKSSGVRDIPWKTVFPPGMKLILNRSSLWPLLLLQRAFYRTSLGLTMLGFGHVPAAA